MDVLLKILVTLALVGCNAYFVAVEFAAVSAREGRLKPLAATSLLARAALRVKSKLDLYLSACQLGNTLAALALGAVTEPAVGSLVEPLTAHLGLGDEGRRVLSFALSFALATSLHIVVGEQAPKNLSIRLADRILMPLAPPLIAFTAVFFPFIWLLNGPPTASSTWSARRPPPSRGPRSPTARRSSSRSSPRPSPPARSRPATRPSSPTPSSSASGSPARS